VVGGFDTPTTEPRGIKWDGMYFWKSNRDPPMTYQLSRDGTQVGTIPNPGNGGIGWDGKYLWGTTRAGVTSPSYIYQIGPGVSMDISYRIFAK